MFAQIRKMLSFLAHGLLCLIAFAAIISVGSFFLQEGYTIGSRHIVVATAVMVIGLTISILSIVFLSYVFYPLMQKLHKEVATDEKPHQQQGSPLTLL